MIGWISWDRRFGWVEAVAPDSPDPTVLSLFRAAVETNMSGIGGGNHQTRNLSQMRFYLGFAEAVKVEEVSPHDAESCHLLAHRVVSEIPYSNQAPNMLLHILFPDEFEAVTLLSEKQKILNSFGLTPSKPDLIDQQLSSIREELSVQLGRADFTYFDSDVRKLWDTPSPNKGNGEKSETLKLQTVPSISQHNLDELSLSSNISESQLTEVVHLIHAKKQIIFEGPPGVGKTYVARLFARYLAGVGLDDAESDRVEIVQFHQSYGYEDFVAGFGR